MLGFYHYTDKTGWNSIRSQVDWIFKTAQPNAAERPAGAYFTDIEPSPINLRTLFKRLRVPKVKQEYVFAFEGSLGLSQLNQSRGRDLHIYYSPLDYEVAVDRQRYVGPTGDWMEGGS